MTDTVEAFYAAINARSAEALAPVLAENGVFADPMAASDSRAGFMEHAARLAAIFPDLRFEALERAGQAVRWRMTGTFAGELRANVLPTGKRVELEGSDWFELAGARVASLRRHYDQKSLYERMGLMALVQPQVQNGQIYGYSKRVPGGKPRQPGIIALTWIQARSEQELDGIRRHSVPIIENFLKEPGFVGIVTGFAGDRGFNVTAWEDNEALQRGLRMSGHLEAMRDFYNGLAGSVWTSVWQPHHLNALWMRCPSCNAANDVREDARQCVKCGGALPPKPAFW